MPLAAFPMHQHISMLKLFPCFLQYFTAFVTSMVFTTVTIGIGDDIHRAKASLREVSFGLISVFIILFCLLITPFHVFIDSEPKSTSKGKKLQEGCNICKKSFMVNLSQISKVFLQLAIYHFHCAKIVK